MDKVRVSKKEQIFGAFKQTISKTGELSKSMRIKLFLILVMLISTMVFGALVILTVTGTFTTGLRETKSEIEEQLNHISQEIESQYGQLSIYAVEFSKDLSANIEKELKGQNLTTTDLKEHPEILDEIIGEEYERCMFALQRVKSSGVFMILEATVNPTLENSENSRAGLYIKSNEPNIINSFTPKTLILRGPSSIGRQNSITLHSQWRMEFDVSNAPYYNRPIEEAKNDSFSLSQLYYWNPSMTLPGNTEEIMICSVPLVDSKGNIFGVCGFEISAMMFKLSYIPDSNIYRRIFCVFSPYNKELLDTSQAFFSGGYSVRKMAEENQKLRIKYNRSLNSYRQEDRTLFRGLHRSVKLYPKGSAFEKESWTVAMMMPESDMSTHITRANFQIGALFMILLSLGVLGSYFLSKRYIMPITKSIDIIKSNNFSEALKTNFSEIDDLMEFLSSNKEKNTSEKEIGGEALERKPIERLPTSLFDEFVKNTGTLSPAERAVFNLYVEGYTAKEITEILSLSINTIKTHNKRIYMKLNVNSREELLLYVNMLKEAGREMK